MEAVADKQELQLAEGKYALLHPAPEGREKIIKIFVRFPRFATLIDEGR